MDYDDFKHYFNGWLDDDEKTISEEIVDQFGFEIIQEQKDFNRKCIIDNHEKGAILKLKEKNFQPWIVCKYCGLPLEKVE